MKKMRVVSMVFTLFLIFGFYGAALGGGLEDPACTGDPFPDASQCDKTTVYANITVARALDCVCAISPPITPNSYNVHVVVRDKKNGKPKKVHLFSFSTPRGTGNLCDLDEEFLFDEFIRRFCTLGVQEVFGFDGVAVIKELKIVRVQEEDCGTAEEMMQLEVVLCDGPAPPIP